MEQAPGQTKASRRRALLGAILALGLASPSLGGVFDVPAAHAGTDDVAATRAEVRQIQKQLNALGYAAGPVDGKYGQTTRQAILQFERDHDLPAVGMPDDAVRERIADALRRKRRQDDSDTDPPDQNTAVSPQGEDDQGDTDINADTTGDITGDTGGELSLPGTRWRLHHPQGQNIVLEFQRGGAIEAPAGNWRWERRKDGRVVIHYDSGSRLTSRLVGQVRGPRQMRGWGQDTFGERWQWSADRLNADPGS